MSNEITGPGSIFSKSAPELLQSHLNHLSDGSGISVEVILERGYRSLLGKEGLKQLGFSPAQQRTPGILIPLRGVDGKEAGYQYRPDNPRLDSRQRPVKYESPAGSANRLDSPPRCQKALADPQVPLWVTEGVKKADALASRGACAVSLTGVWGFKGKNEFGGVTILSDWDYIALRERTIYLAFDSDVIAKQPVKKALDRLTEHLRRKGAGVLVVHLPQDGDKKVGIDDYLLNHPIDDAQKLAIKPSYDEEESKDHSVAGFVLRDGTIGEMVVSDEERCFVVFANGSVRKAYHYETTKTNYIPTRDPLVGQVVHFATTAAPYASQATLFAEVKEFVHRYLELPADFEDIASLYVLLTWVYEFAPSIPYLRVIGDWGSGKTRFLQVVGSVCFRPIFASGATTPAPIFRILEQFQGTLVLDEADFKDSSSWVEMIKVLNNGYRPGMPVLRADKENGKWYPRSYQVFGPKLIATRHRFKDEALESRCLTAEMMPLTRDDIPRVLPPSFDKEVETLRSKLLTFRLANLLRLKGKTFGNELLEPDLQPRLQEILIPLKAMLNGDRFMSEALASFVHRLQEAIYTRRRESDAGRALAAIIELYQEGQELSLKNISEKVSEIDEEAPTLNSEKLGWVTKRLGFTKDKGSSSRRRVICWEPERVEKLARQYGLTLETPLSHEKPFKPFEAFELALTGAKGFDSSPEPFEKPFECELVSEAKGVKGSKGFLEDKENNVTQALGMSIAQALSIWTGEGKPVIHLGPGENCFDLERLLSHRDINSRHLEVIRNWLIKKSETET